MQFAEHCHKDTLQGCRKRAKTELAFWDPKPPKHKVLKKKKKKKKKNIYSGEKKHPSEKKPEEKAVYRGAHPPQAILV